MNPHTPGTIRAGQRIHAVLKLHLPLLPDSNAATLTKIIDAETRAPELLDALEGLLEACPTSCEDRALIDAQRKAEKVIELARQTHFELSTGERR